MKAVQLAVQEVVPDVWMCPFFPLTAQILGSGGVSASPEEPPGPLRGFPAGQPGLGALLCVGPAAPGGGSGVFQGTHPAAAGVHGER